MQAPHAAVLIIFGLIVAVFALMILNRRREERAELKKKMQNSWGRSNPRLFSAQEMESIRSLAELSESPGAVDAITAHDLDLESVFGAMGGMLMSSPGEEVLWSFLVHPVFDREAMDRRIRIQDYLIEEEAGRERILEALHHVGRLQGGSFSHYIRQIRGAEAVGSGKYAALGLLTLLLIALLFVQPLAAVPGLVIVLVIDFRVHLAMKQKTRPVSRGFQAVLRLLEGARELAELLPEELMGEDARRLKELTAAFSSFRHGSSLVATAGNVGTGFSSALLEYANLLFHADLIQYDRMLSSIGRYEAEALELVERIGEIDALCAAASWYVSGQEGAEAAPPAGEPVRTSRMCRPVFMADAQTESGVPVLEVTDLVHPLRRNHVPNSIRADRQVLLTGSNASGKSTFLKSIALSAIMAQSVGIVTASSYKAPFFRVLSSMALSDNLKGGESYFVVEIRSLKRICDAALAPEPPVLALVDEVLRGTNTIERIAASSHILLELGRRHALVFAATHDIELSYLLEKEWRNLHFLESTEGGDIHFDYVLKEGRARTGNAIRLLEENGYPADVTQRAFESARHFEESGEWILKEPD